MKGRTNQPIVIDVAVQWLNHPAVKELKAAGHVIRPFTVPELGDQGGKQPDVILHPAAHGWSEAMFEQGTRKNGTTYRPFLDAAVKAGRQRRRKA